MPTVLDDDDAKANGGTFPGSTPKNSRNSLFAIAGRRDLLPLLIQRIEQLSPKAKKILAMYYYENLSLSEIAASFRQSECQIDEIRTETVGSLNHFLLSVSVKR